MLRKSIAGLSTMLTVAVLGVGFVAMPAAATTTGITVPDQFCTPAQTIVDQEAYDEVVVDQEAYDETVIVIEAQHYSLKGNSGIEKDETPAAPWGDDDYWQANTQQEPHSSDNVSWLNESHTGLHYTSNGSEGLRDWFYFQPEVSRTVHHDEVSHIEHHDAVTHEVPEVCDLWVTWATDTWAPDANDANDVAWPQQFVAFGQVSPTVCETTYQQDRYQGSRADIDAVIGDGTLAGLPPEDSGIVTDWAFVSTATCGDDDPPPPCEAVDTPVWHVWTGGPIESDEGPAPDAEGWNANSGNPQSANHAYENHTAGVPYFVSNGNSGNGDWFLWTLEDCPPPVTDYPVPALFDVDPAPATCDADGVLDTALFPIDREGYVLTVDRPYDGPGEYTITATAKEGFVIQGEFSKVVTVDPQNTDPVACPQDVDDEDPEDPVEVSDELDAPPAKAVEAEAQFAG